MKPEDMDLMDLKRIIEEREDNMTTKTEEINTELLKACKTYVEVYKLNNPDLLAGLYSTITNAIAKAEGKENA